MVRFGVGIKHHHGNRGTGGAPFEHARQNLYLVGFFALRRDFALPDAASLELDLDDCFVECNTRRTAVEDTPDGDAVRLAEGGHAEDRTKGIACHRLSFKC